MANYTIDATGGNITDVEIGGKNYRIHAFTNLGSSNFEVLKSDNQTPIDFLIVGGGGAGGGYEADRSGGGGAGGLIFGNATIGTGNYSVTVGAGGNKLDKTEAVNRNGQNSSFLGNIAYGGGGGGNGSNDTPAWNPGANGGSGGGAGNGRTYKDTINSTMPGGDGISGQGNDGGNSVYQPSGYGGGGGGGAGAAGQSGTSSIAGDGGDGLYYGNYFTDNYGENGWFAGGGGGSHYDPFASSAGDGGLGGGGNGSIRNKSSGTYALARDGLPNTGGGGGGEGNATNSDAGNGGSGIVLIRYELIVEVTNLKNIALGDNQVSFNSVSFDGLDDYAEIPTNSSTHPKLDYTYEMWLYPQQSGGSIIFNRSTFGGFTLILENDYSPRVTFFSEIDFNPANNQVIPNEWNHVAFTVSTSKILKYYVNGVFSGSQSFPDVSYSSNPTYFMVGYDRDNPTGTRSNFMLGKIREVRIWHTELSELDIQNNKDKSLTGNETDLAVYYKFDEGTGTTINDIAGANDGTLYGPTWSFETITKETKSIYLGTQNIIRVFRGATFFWGDQLVSKGITQDDPATGAIEVLETSSLTPENGLYWLNIGDGRGVQQYYCVFDYPGGPYVMVAQNMSDETGASATFGIQNNGSPSDGNIGSTTHFNTDIANNNIPAEAYMITNDSDAIFYTTLDSSSRTAIYNELKDTSGETSRNSNAYTGFTSPGGAIYSNKTNSVSSWSNTGAVIELHHSGWNSGNSINYMIEIGRTSRSPGDGASKNLRGFDRQGYTIFAFSTLYEGNDYHFIKI